MSTNAAHHAMRRLGVAKCYACGDFTTRPPIELSREALIFLLRAMRAKVRKRASVERRRSGSYVDVRLCDGCVDRARVIWR